MNLTKALKEKKKLIGKIQKAYEKFQKYNSHEAGVITPFDAEQSYNEWLKLTNELVELKSKIQIANQPIYSKIFEMAELKNMIQQVRRITTTEGMQPRSKGYGVADVDVEYKAFMNIVNQEKTIESWEDKIETLQSEIEEFNAITKI